MISCVRREALFQVFSFMRLGILRSCFGRSDVEPVFVDVVGNKSDCVQCFSLLNKECAE